MRKLRKLRKLLIFISLLFVSPFVRADLEEVITAIQTIRPGAEWSLSGETYEGLIWLDQVQTKPTKQEILNEVANARLKIERQEVWAKRVREYPLIQQQILMILNGEEAQLRSLLNEVDQKYPLP